MPINSKVKSLYDAMKADGADVGTEQEFNDYFFAKGEQGYKNRKAVYDAFKADGADVGENYEEFASWLQLQAQPKTQKPQQPANQTSPWWESDPSYQQDQQQYTQKPAPATQTPWAAAMERRKQAQQPQQTDYVHRPEMDEQDILSGQALRNTVNQRREEIAQVPNQGMEYARQEQARQQQPVVKTGTPADQSVIKTQGQWEDEVRDSAAKSAADLFGTGIDYEVGRVMDEATKRWTEQFDPRGMVGEFAGMDALRRANQEIDPDRLVNDLTRELQNRIGGWLQQDGKSESIVDAAQKLGMSPDDYGNMVVNNIVSQAQQKLYQKVKEGYMPKGTADYILNGLHDSLIGTMMDMTTMTKGQRQMMQQANHEFSQKNKEENYWGGTITDLVRGGVGFMGDAPVFGVLGKVAAPMVRGTGALLESVGVRTTMGMSDAAFERLSQTVLNNSSWLQRIKFGAGRAIAGSAYNFGLYEGANAVVQDLSVGEDTSLGTLAGDFIEGFGKGSVKGAVLGTVSRPFQGVSPRFGVRSDMNWGQKVLVGTGKGALATGNIMAEGLGFTAGAYLVDEEARNRVKDSEKPWEVVLQDTMENTMMAGIFKIMSVHNLQDPVGSLRKAFEAPADSRFNFQRWQMKEIEEAYGGKESFVSAIEQIALSADADRNTQMSRFYEDFMNRNDISWDTKNKVSAILTGNMATVPPIPSRISIDNDRNEVVALGRRGEVLFRREFKTQEEADAIKAQLDMSREEQMLHNLIGTFLVKDEEGNVNPESQKQLDDTIAEVGYETALNKEGIINALNKAPEKRSEMEQYAIEELFGRLYEMRFPNNQPHPAQDHQNGRDIAEETLHIDELDPEKNPNGVEPGKYDLLTQAYDEANKALEAAFKNNDTFYQFVKEQRDNGLSDGEIAIEARKMAFSEEESQALIDFERAKEQMDGYVELTGERIGEYVSNEVSGMSFKGELDGQEVKDRFVRVVDDEGNEYYLRTGKVTVGENGRLVSTDGSGTVIVRDAQGKDKMVLADTMSMAPEDPSNPMRDDIAAYSELRTTQLQEAISLAIDPEGKMQQTGEPKSQGQLAYEQEQGDVEQNGGLVKNDLADQTLSETLRGSLHTLGRKIGKKIQVVTKEELKQINPLAPDNARGMRSADNKTLYLVSDYVKDNEYMQRFVTGHELTHSIKTESGDAKTWNAFVDAVRSHMGDKAFDEAVKRVEELYEKSGVHLDREAAIEEVCSDWAGEHLTDDASIRHIVESVERAGKDPVTFTQRIKQLFEDMIAAITGSGRTLSNSEREQLEKLIKARDLWEQMYNECVAKNEARDKAAESQRLAEQRAAEERKARETKGVVFGEDGEADYLRMPPEATIADLSEQAGSELVGGVIGTMLGNAKKTLKGVREVKPKSDKPSDVIAAAKETSALRKAAQDAVDYWQSVSDKHKELEVAAKEEAKRQAAEAARLQTEDERQERLKTPEGRVEEIVKANVTDRPKVAQEIYGDAFNGDMTPNGVEEYVMAHFSGATPELGKGFIDTDSIEQETGHKVDGFGGDSKAYYPYLAGRGKGKTLAQVAEDIWHGMPEGLQSMTDDAAIKNMVIDLLTGAQKATDIRDALFNSRIAQAERTLAGEAEHGEEPAPSTSQSGQIDPRKMSDEDKRRRGDMLRYAPAISVAPNQIVSTPELSARKVAEKWWDEHVSEPQFFDTEIGEVEINRNTVESSLAHRYGQMKLDAITSLVEGFENAVYLGTMPDSTRQEGVLDHYFAYPIMYDGQRCYVFCRALQDNNTNRLYVHEVFVAEKIKKRDTLQTAASQPHGGISLYRDILANVLDVDSPELSGSKGTEKSSTVQGKGKDFSGINTADPLEAIDRAADLFNGGGVSDDMPFSPFEGDAPFSIDNGKGQGGASFSLAGSTDEFERTRERAVRERGIVMPGLKSKKVSVVDVPKHTFTGESPIGQAEAWAKENIAGTHRATDSNGNAFDYRISNTAIGKFLSESSIKKSENLGVHLAVLTKLPEVISESIEAEVHPDYQKNEEGVRLSENGCNSDRLIHRFYGAALLDGKVYRVKTTMIEDIDPNKTNKPHSYEVSKIEMVEDNPTTSWSPMDGENRSIEAAKLLNGVEKSYDSGKKLLDESKDLTNVEKNSALDNTTDTDKTSDRGIRPQSDVQYSLSDDPMEAIEKAAEAFRKEREEQRVKSFHDMIDDLFTNPDFDKSAHSRMHYDLGDTPEYMKKLGISGERFTMQFKNIKTHMGKDADHNLTAKEWHELPDAIKKPFLITTYGNDEGKFRLYTTVKVGDKFAVVGVDVVKVNKGKGVPMLELNRIKTVFGRDRYVFENGENILAYDENITPEQEALLRGHNFREYPSIQELSAGKDTVLFSKKKELIKNNSFYF